MSGRKRGFDEEAESSQQGSAKKAARCAPGDPSVDTSLSLRQPGGVADDRSDTEQLQSQAAAGRTQEEEQAVAAQGRGRGVQRRNQDLIWAIDHRGTSSVNRQAGGINVRGRGRAQVPQSQGNETVAGKDAMSITGPWSCPGNATGMGAPIPGIGAPPQPRPLMEAAMRQVTRRQVDQFMSQPAVRQQLAAVGMPQRLGTTLRPGVPPLLPQAQHLNPVANHFRGTSSVNRQAGGINGAGGWRAPMLQSQGNETLAAIRAAMGMTGPGIYPGNATGMGAPIPGIGAPPLPRPLTEEVMWQVIRRQVDHFMSQLAVRQQLAAIGMQQRLGTTPRPGAPPPLTQAQRLNSVANQRGEASRGTTFTRRHDASPSNLHGHPRASAPRSQLVAATTAASGSRQPQERQDNLHMVVPFPARTGALGSWQPQQCQAAQANVRATVPSLATTGIWVPWRPQQTQADVRAAVSPPATTAASVSMQPQQCQAYVHVVILCPDCHNIFPNLGCLVCANVAAQLGIVPPHQQHPHRSPGDAPSISEVELRRIVEVTMANQPGPPIGPNMPRANPLPGSCPGCHRRPGSFHPALQWGVPLHVCLCSVCHYDAWKVCPVCRAVQSAAERRRDYQVP